MLLTNFKHVRSHWSLWCSDFKYLNFVHAVSFNACISNSEQTTALRYCKEVKLRCSVLHWAAVENIGNKCSYVAVEYEWDISLNFLNVFRHFHLTLVTLSHKQQIKERKKLLSLFCIKYSAKQKSPFLYFAEDWLFPTWPKAFRST